MLGCMESTSKDDISIQSGQGDIELEIDDSRLDSIVTEYVRKYEVDPAGIILELGVHRALSREYYSLTQLRNRRIVEGVMPDGFFIYDNKFVVLLDVAGIRFRNSNTLSRLDSTIKEMGITLANDSLDFCPPRWEFVRECNQELRMITSDYLIEYLPCGYRLRVDSVNLSTLSLERK